ncbi:MAG: class I SAM-dependent methyltransferase [Promethearchaeota archaeon]
MKIIGLLTAWASEDWIGFSIKQALELVDELIISIGPHNKYFKEIEDKTLEISKQYFNHNKVKVVKTVCNSFNNPDQNKCATLNRMLKESENIEIGNIIWILDVDEFYSDKAIKEIKSFLNSNYNYDQIRFLSFYFCINFKYYFKSYLIRIFKINSKNIYFTPTQKFHPKPKKTITLLENDPLFHYSLLTGEQLRGIYWLSMDKFKRLIWYMKIYKNYDPKNEKYWMIKNQELTGNYRFWFQSNAIEKTGKGLFKYDGTHPELIENSFLKNISDFRKYMRKKPNYMGYLKSMKKLIKKKKKFNIRKFWRKKSKIIQNKSKLIIKIINFLEKKGILKVKKKKYKFVKDQIKELKKFCNLFGTTLEQAESKLKQVVGINYQYFKTKFTKGQSLEALYFTILSITEKDINNILELGTGKGIMTNILAKLFPNAKIYTIDLPQSDHEYYKLAQRREMTIDKFKKNINLPNIHFIERNSFYLPIMNLPDTFDLIWVDGGHNYPTVSWDLMYSYNRLKKKGFIFMHDYNRLGTDVKHAIDALSEIVPEKINYLPFTFYDRNAKTCWFQKT